MKPKLLKELSTDEIIMWLKNSFKTAKNRNYFFILIDYINNQSFNFNQCFSVLSILYPYAKDEIEEDLSLKNDPIIKLFLIEKEKRKILKTIENNKQPINQPRKTFKI